MLPALNMTLSPVARRAARRLRPLALLTVASLGLCLVTSTWSLGPARDRLARAMKAYEDARQVQLRKEAAHKTLEDLGQLWNLLPERKAFSMLILAISELAQRDHVAIPGMNYAFQNVEGGLAVKAAITFHTAGEYADLRRFIHRLETAGGYLFIESLDASRADDRRSSHRVAINVRIVTYLKPDPAAVASGA
jgi:hypothetical protein